MRSRSAVGSGLLVQMRSKRYSPISSMTSWTTVVCSYSTPCLLSRTIDGVRSDGDESTSLLDRHGYANQCAVNLLLTGRATSNVFDGDKKMDDLVLRGVSERSDVGFLTLLEAYQHCSVGRNFKEPRSRVWVVYSESHYSLLVGDPLTETDLHYWDGLANQDEVIRLSIDEDYYEGREVPNVNDSSRDC